jgi:iron complex outermembrane recepter protein
MLRRGSDSRPRLPLASGLAPFLAAIALGVGAGQAVGQAAGSGGSIEGVVTDEAGVPLARVLVAVVGSDRRVVTDEAGRFLVRGVAPGARRVEATAPGYAPLVREVEVERGVVTRLRLSLAVTALPLPGLLVTGAPTGGAALDLTRSSTQLSGRVLERRMGSSVAETLASEPGVAVRYNGPAASTPVVRGLTGDRVVVMEDGHRSADMAGSAEDHLLTIDPLTAQRVEVIRGPAALLYGSNAMGGVVNVLTGTVPTEGIARPELAAALHVQSAYPGATATARATTPVSGPWSLGLRLSARSTGDVRIGRDPSLADGGGRLPETWLRQGGGAVSLGYGGSRVTGGATIRGFGFGYGLPMPPEEDEAVSVEGRLLAATGRVEVALGARLFPVLRVSGSISDYAHDELGDGELAMSFGLRTGTVEIQTRQAAGGLLDEGAWGVSGSRREYAATGDDRLTPPAVTSAAGIFTYQQLPVGGGVTVEMGLRLDRHAATSTDDPAFGPGSARSFTALSGSLGASVALAPGVTGALSVARSFRAPTVEELFSDAPHAGTASYEIGDPGLGPETLLGVDAVIRLRRARVVGEASVYASRIADFITFVARGDTLIDGVPWPVLAYTQDGAVMRGAEATVDWEVREGVILGARGDLVRGELDAGGAVPFLPPARLGGSVRWEPGRVSLGAEAIHGLAQRRVSGDPDIPTDAYTLFSVDARLRLIDGHRSHSVTFRVANLTDLAYRDAASRIKRFAPNPGRDISLLYRVHF